jgi:hypothetical protein
MDADEEPENENKIVAAEEGFQLFMMKATRIVAIFLKDLGNPHELTRSVL